MFDLVYSRLNRAWSHTPTSVHAPLGRASDSQYTVAAQIRQMSDGKLLTASTPSLTLPEALLQRFIVVRGNTPASRPGMSLLSERCTH